MYRGEDKVIEILKQEKELTLQGISERTGLNEDTVRRIAESLKGSGHVTIESQETTIGIPTDEFEEYYQSEFPEMGVFRKAQQGASVSDLDEKERSIGLRWARVKGLVAIEGGKLSPVKAEDEAQAIEGALKKAYEDVRRDGTSEDKVVLDELFQRHLLKKKTSRASMVQYTGKAFEKEAAFNLNVPGSDAPLGKNHPITRITKRMKRIMTELGFQEMEGDIVESSFWCFDALFQPQDHPARELADTFHLDKRIPLPDDAALVERVKRSHESGWRYKWDPLEAQKAVLRTHTTCLSARYLAKLKDKSPRKYFAIGRVFRNEATDYKHLAEFHQVEGIIAWDKAKFTDLLGILREFYRKLGFEQIRFRPSFFPYTEPSLEIEVYYEKKRQWLELGGAGIFRPEVSVPLADVYPVLAWGLSLERPMMLALDLDDIRTPYRNELDFLSSTRGEL